jgi:hypothetical protein
MASNIAFTWLKRGGTGTPKILRNDVVVTISGREIPIVKPFMLPRPIPAAPKN